MVDDYRFFDGYFDMDDEIVAACLALRRDLCKSQRPDEGEDFACPLDVVLQGYRVVHSPDAVAYDTPPGSPSTELKVRVRMTSRNFIGTLRRWGFVNWFRHPAISFGLLSHNVLRWLSPYFLVIALIANVFLLGEGLFYWLTFGAQLLFYLAAFLGWTADLLGRRVLLVSSIFSFCIANLGMLIGVAVGVAGRAPAHYEQA